MSNAVQCYDSLFHAMVYREIKYVCPFITHIQVNVFLNSSFSQTKFCTHMALKLIRIKNLILEFGVSTLPQT